MPCSPRPSKLGFAPSLAPLVARRSTPRSGCSLRLMGLLENCNKDLARRHPRACAKPNTDHPPPAHSDKVVPQHQLTHEPARADAPAPIAAGPSTRQLLLLFTSYPSAEHLHALTTCWPKLIRASPLLLAADVLHRPHTVDHLNLHCAPIPSVHCSARAACVAQVLLHVNGVNETAAGPFAAAQWRRALSALPNERTGLEAHDRNPGKQEGALYSMHVALQRGWFSGYEWVLRINPDVYIYDDEFLSQQLHDPYAPLPTPLPRWLHVLHVLVLSITAAF